MHQLSGNIFHEGRLIEKEPKTKSSMRCIAVDEGLVSLLRDHKKWWIQQRLLNGDRWVATDKLFIKENGGVMHLNSITDYTKKFRERHNLPHFSPHSLRHTNISLMIAAGIDIKTVSSRARSLKSGRKDRRIFNSKRNEKQA
jgi:site-specific recombinase XerD